MNYINKNVLNIEAFKFIEKVQWLKAKAALIQNSRILISLKAGEENQNSDEWVGFIQTIKKIMKTSNMKVVDEVANQSEKLDKVEKKIIAQSEKITAQQQALEDKFTTLEDKFTSQQQALEERLSSQITAHSEKMLDQITKQFDQQFKDVGSVMMVIQGQWNEKFDSKLEASLTAKFQEMNSEKKDE